MAGACFGARSARQDASWTIMPRVAPRRQQLCVRLVRRNGAVLPDLITKVLERWHASHLEV